MVLKCVGLGFWGCTSFSVGLAMASSSKLSPNGGLHVLVDDLKLNDPMTYRAQQVNIIFGIEREFRNVLSVSS
jgi:hypothetical protein